MFSQSIYFCDAEGVSCVIAFFIVPELTPKKALGMIPAKGGQRKHFLSRKGGHSTGTELDIPGSKAWKKETVSKEQE